MIESQYTQKIRDKLSPHMYAWKIADMMAGGVPDNFYRNTKARFGKPLWVEYKLIKKLPARGSTLVVPALSDLQKLWMRQAFEANEYAWVILGCEEMRDSKGIKGVIFKHPEVWEKGIQCADLRNMDWLSYQRIADAIEQKTSG